MSWKRRISEITFVGSRPKILLLIQKHLNMYSLAIEVVHARNI